jgi:hypothetical protein
MTPDQAAQAFEKDGNIRPLNSQRAFLASKSRCDIIEVTKDEKPYMVSGNKLLVSKPCSLTIQELGMILSNMRT